MADPDLPWNGTDSRAFLPTPALLKSTVVVSSSTLGVMQSPSPFSVGVYVYDDSDQGLFHPLPLVYVSERAAEEKAKNFPLIPAGWYLPVSEAEFGKRFEVSVTICVAKFADFAREELAGFERAMILLRVNGKSPGVTKNVSLTQATRGRASFLDRRFQGHMSRRTATTSSSGTDTIHSFNFNKPEVEEIEEYDGGVSRDDVGVIELKLCKAKQGPPRAGSKDLRTPGGAVGVSEKEVMKKGLGLAMSGNGKVIVKKTGKLIESSVGKTPVPSLGFKIYVRDQSWLVRRGIIESKVGADQEAVASTPASSKHPKVEKVVAQAMVAQATGSSSKTPLNRVKSEGTGDIIDLTL